jgi:hypothetical protein
MMQREDREKGYIEENRRPHGTGRGAVHPQA